MFTAAEEMHCGIFDSNILHKNHQKSQNRTVACYELELFHIAGGTSHVDGGNYPARRGMLLCAKPGQVRHSDFPVRCSFIRIAPGRDDGVDRLLSSFPDCFYIENGSEIEELMGLFAKMGACSVSSAPEETNVLRMNGVLFEILYRCARLVRGVGETPTGAPANRIARDAYEYINEKFCTDCSLKSIAEALHVSPNYLHTVFRRDIGCTPFELVIRKRIEKAKKLIAAGEKTMLEVALETGFCSQSHFNKVFKEQTGQTPIAYRRGLLERY